MESKWIKWLIVMLGVVIISSPTNMVAQQIAPDKTVMLIADEQFVYGWDLYDAALDAFSYDFESFAYAPALAAYELDEPIGGLQTAFDVLDFHARFYSVNPKVLLTLLEVTSEVWENNERVPNPLGLNPEFGQGFYDQIDWLAGQLAVHYYEYTKGKIKPIVLKDGASASLDPLNAATYAISQVMAQVASPQRWRTIVAQEGEFVQVYRQFFDQTPRIPDRPRMPLSEPVWSLPYAVGHSWYFTGGPHEWNGTMLPDGLPWSAVDFQPQDVAGTCNVSGDYTRAVAPGNITYAQNGFIVISHGGGWETTYYHQVIDVGLGYVDRGTAIGRSSCYGCPGCGSHVHFTTRINGVYQPINGKSFNCWVVHNGAAQYQGTIERDGVTRYTGQLVDNNGCLRGVDAEKPVVNIVSYPNIDSWYNANETLSWTITDVGGSGIRGYKYAWDKNPPGGSERSGSSGSTSLSSAGQGRHTLYVQAWDNAGNPSDVTSAGWFGYDTQAPLNPTSVDSGCDAANNIWQNTCNDPNFTWGGASDRNGIGVKDYHYYWGKSPSGVPVTYTLSDGFDPPAVPGSVVEYYLRVSTRDELSQESEPAIIFVLLYDSVPPSVTLQINHGAETANQVDVTLNLSASDTGSGVAEVCVSNRAGTCDNWQPYTDAIPWTLPALDRREHTVYIWVRDKAGNEAHTSDTITLDLYPPQPHSTNYRICDNVLDAAGSTALTSTNYALVSAIGQPWATGAAANTSGAFGEHSGFLASITGCLPITRAVTGNYTVTQWVVASGGNLRGSTSYRLGDTAGQPAASGTNAFTSTSYTLSSGFWAQITGTVPPTTTIQPTPPITSVPSPTQTVTPTPTPTPPPSSFGISINDGALYTNDPRVIVKVWAPNVTHMRLSNDGGFVDSVWRGYQITSTWVISTSGSYAMPRLIYVQFKDAQSTIYGPYVDDIVYDPIAPQGSVRIVGTAPMRLSEASVVTLSLEASDGNSGVTQMRITDTLAGLDTTSWRPYTNTLSWVLDAPVVYAQFQDQAGNESLIYDSRGAAHALDRRPMEVTIQDMANIAGDTAHFFIASVSPSSVTLPLTYTWQATGQAPVTHANQLSASDGVSFTWDTYGPKVITATATNSLGSASGTRGITLTETPSCPAPLTDVTITGSLSGETGTVYTFTSVLTPTDATLPITYTWSPEPNSGQGAAEATYSWDAPGEKGVTLRVENCGGTFTATHVITIVAQPPACPVPLTDVGIDAPTSGEVDTPYTFQAQPVPTDATQPITYTWSPEPDSGQDSATAEYEWATPDTYTLTLTAENCGGSFGAAHRITIADTQRYVYLPLVLRSD